MNLLLFDFGSYMTSDLRFYLEQAGHHVQYLFADTEGNDLYNNEELEAVIERELHGNRFDAVVSCNFFPFIGKVCARNSIKYLAWSNDAPMNLPREEGFDYPTNHIFLFDRTDYLRYKKKGLDMVYHLPLAVNCSRLRAAAKNVIQAERGREFTCDISFLGVLYESTLPVLKSKMNDYDQGFVDALVRVQSDLYGAWLVDDLLTEERIGSINRHYKSLSETAIQITDAQLSYAIATHITHRDRLSLLKLLSEHHDVLLCSDPLSPLEEQLLPNVRKHGRISYAEEMPVLFQKSKINLNATLRCIKTGIPLRALDICGSGGFLLSNYQEELAEHFVPGEEVVLYESIPDAIEKAKWYLAHDEERKKVAQAGYARVESEFRFEDRIHEMFRIAGL